MIDTKLKPGQTIGAFNPDRKAFKKYESSNLETGHENKSPNKVFDPVRMKSQILEEKMIKHHERISYISEKKTAPQTTNEKVEV